MYKCSAQTYDVDVASVTVDLKASQAIVPISIVCATPAPTPPGNPDEFNPSNVIVIDFTTVTSRGYVMVDASIAPDGTFALITDELLSGQSLTKLAFVNTLYCQVGRRYGQLI
jgi:hypothetical protein